MEVIAIGDRVRLRTDDAGVGRVIGTRHYGPIPVLDVAWFAGRIVSEEYIDDLVKEVEL